MNVSNSTSPALTDEFFRALIIVEGVVKFLALSTNVAYILIVLRTKKMREKTLLYLNHAAVTNIFYLFILFIYTFGDRPATSMPDLNQALCSISELFWPFSNYIRAYSILLIAVYRYLATFHMNAFKLLNESTTILVSPILAVWFVCIVVPVSLKYSFNTRPSMYMCLDGNSSVYVDTILYFALNFLFMVMVPSALTMLIYVKIMRRLTAIKLRLWTSTVDETMGTDTTVSNGLSTLGRRNRDRRFAKQFALMCVSMILSAGLLALIWMRNVVPDYWDIFHYWRPIFRLLISISVSFIPVISIYFNPNRKRIFSQLIKFSSNSKS